MELQTCFFFTPQTRLAVIICIGWSCIVKEKVSHMLQFVFFFAKSGDVRETGSVVWKKKLAVHSAISGGTGFEETNSRRHWSHI